MMTQSSLTAFIAILLMSQVVASQGNLLRRGTPFLQEELTSSNSEESGGHYHHRVLERGPGGIPSIVEGKLGNIGDEMKQAGNEAFRQAAGDALKDILKTRFGSHDDFQDEIQPEGKTNVDKMGCAHQRFKQKINGYSVEGASLVLHTDSSGEITRTNGEYVDGRGLPTVASLSSEEALEKAIKVRYHEDMKAEVIGTAKLAVVRSPESGYACFAWKALVKYVEPDSRIKQDTIQHTLIFADANTGYPCALHPLATSSESIRLNLFDHKYQPQEEEDAGAPPTSRRLEPGTPSLETYNCFQGTECDFLVSDSSTEIHTGDLAINSAHNFAIATYNYFWDHFGRDSLDGNGVTLASRVHFDSNFIGAFWDTTQMTYGDGDGIQYGPFSQEGDVVAHEFTHGLTQFTSGLINQGESGALDEAMSDIFGALVDRETGATGDDIWFMGEDVLTPGIPGDAVRNMKNPRQASSYDRDFYPERYQGFLGRGGVHWNSGIANLAFYLLVEGGSHPARKSLVLVQGIGFDAAAEIFYQANVNCLTPSSTFYTARYCTANVHGGEYESNVHAAWDAVGVPREQAPPSPTPPTTPPANWEYALFIQTDLYSTDTTWKITDTCDNNREVWSGGPYYTSFEANTYYIENPSRYVLTIFDLYEDGICCAAGNGYFTVTNKNGTLLTFGSDFDSGITASFGDACAPSTKPEEYEYELHLQADNYPVDITWAIRDECDGGREVMIGGPYGERFQQVTNYLIKPSRYALGIADAYNDGICCESGDGSFTVTDKNGVELVNLGDYGPGTWVSFGSCPWQEIVFDGFENGWSNFNTGHGKEESTSKDEQGMTISTSYPHTGSHSLRLPGGSCVSVPKADMLDVSAYSAVKVDFFYLTTGLENGAAFFLEYSSGHREEHRNPKKTKKKSAVASVEFEHEEWLEIDSWVFGEDLDRNFEWFEVTDAMLDVSAIYSVVHLRFRVDGKDNDDEMIYLDDVKISGRV